MKPLELRFWEKVKKTEGCWIWTGAKNPSGHGTIMKGRRSEGILYAHRVSWEIHNGLIPKSKNQFDYCILHKCDNPPCVNPKHLFLGTQYDNIKDCIKKKRRNSVKGEKHGHSKLTEKQIIDIRSKTFYYGERAKLARKLGISEGTLSNIISRKIWKHI